MTLTPEQREERAATLRVAQVYCDEAEAWAEFYGDERGTGTAHRFARALLAEAERVEALEASLEQIKRRTRPSEDNHKIAAAALSPDPKENA